MTEKRIQFRNIVRNQLPAYVTEQYPLVAEFISQYYLSQEFQGAPTDLIQNIDKYTKLDNITNLKNTAVLNSDISSLDSTITVSLSQTTDSGVDLSGTVGFPDSYGLLLIDDEIITYTGKTETSFTGCIRGFSGVSSLKKKNSPDELVFSSTSAAAHTSGATITNLSNLFLNEFLLKTKYQLTPGLDSRSFDEGLNQNLFIKQAKDFYLSKGTPESFKILFKALYNEEVDVIKPKEYIFKPSDAQYRVTNSFVVEAISGDPEELVNATLFQDEYETINKAYAPVAQVEKITSNDGKTYYKIGIDAGYSRDIRVDGSVYGDFSIHPKSKLIKNVSANSTYLDVDSTVGFPESGELYVTYNDNTTGTVTYTSKSYNQFFGCSNISKTILDGSSIAINTFAYGYSPTNELIKIRVNSVIEDIEIVDDTFYLNAEENIQVKTLGVNPKDNISNNWFFNVSASFSVKNFSLVDNSELKTYLLETNEDNYLKIGDFITLINVDGLEKNGQVASIQSLRSFNFTSSEIIVSPSKVKRSLSKSNTQYFPDSSNINTNVQNVYKIKDRTLVASSSIPTYLNQKLDVFNRAVTISGTFAEGTSTFTITSQSDHGFYTGDAIYYTPQKITVSTFNDDITIESTEILSSLFDEGIYFIKRVDKNNVKFARSLSDINTGNFITLSLEKTVSDNTIIPYRFNGKTLSHQKLLREISFPTNDGKVYETKPGNTGILINGVEILNYKSKDVVYYGNLEDVEVTSPGFGYDVINPPAISISDEVGTGATGYVSVRGFLDSIRIVDPGFDYVSTPTVTITGGNGSGASASVNLKSVIHSATFNSQQASNQISLGSTQSIIGFSTFHKFRDSERVIYKTDGQNAIGGISTEASYYISIQSPTSVKLHKTFEDSAAGINTVVLTSYGTGNHRLQSYNLKSVIDSINVVNSGSGYENKKRTVTSSGINTTANIITISNHQYNSGELVKYTSTGSPIGGLTSGSQYYITRLNSNDFRLSQVNSNESDKNFYYRNNQYVSLTGFGSGTHTFNYPDISVVVEGNIGVSSVSGETFQSVVQPIFSGEITSVHLSNGGQNYGSNSILNYNRQPLVTLINGRNAQLNPVISNGRIVEVLVNNVGSGYISVPRLLVLGGGFGAVITPVIENGQITEVKVINGGSGYQNGVTSIQVIPAGQGAEFNTKIKTWTVNLFQKYLSSVSGDDGFLSDSPLEKYGLQYTHLYAPRKLRESAYSVSGDGNTLYGKLDLTKRNNTETSSTSHSPIIGWAYDGNPIYGPYGYETKNGGRITQMKSGYKLEPSANRPSSLEFPVGFFVEDYAYNEVNEEDVLDENNGRFCITPEYPNGTYAYFSTINDSSSDSFGPFAGYRSPAFPYLIGNNYKSKPIDFNFENTSNQDNINLNETNWVRNTTPYNLLSYEYATIPNSLDQKFKIRYSSPGSIESVGINSGGVDYKVNDRVIFDKGESGGDGADVRVSRIKGKQVNSVSVASSNIFNVEFYPFDQKGTFIAFSPNPHNFLNQQTISITGINTTSSSLEGSYRVGVSSIVLAPVGLGTSTIAIQSSSTTGIVTYIGVIGNISRIRENDILGIGTERVKVLNVDYISSRLRILREVNGTVGSSHSISELLYEDPRKLTFEVGLTTNSNYRFNKEIYFNPVESIGLGTLSGVGIGTTITFSNPGSGISSVFIPTKTIYLPAHNLKTGDELVYNVNVGSGISVSTNGSTIFALSDQSTVYVAKISDDLIGISTVKVGLGTTGSFVGIASTQSNQSTLYFTGIGTGVYHSFKTNYPTIKGQLLRNLVTVSTAQTHGLLNEDVVNVSVKSGITTSVVVKYNDYNRKLLINPKDFVSGGVSTTTNSINIPNHNFYAGQKVLHTSTSPAGGLNNNQEYYIVVDDQNNIKLSDTYLNSISPAPVIVDISSSSSGTISQINPEILITKNSTVQFDLSDISLSYSYLGTKYPAFNLKFYKDSNFVEEFNTTGKDVLFDVRKSGVVGTNGLVTIYTNELFPEKLFYKLVPLETNGIPKEKYEADIDDTVFANNQITFLDSFYNGEYQVSVASSTSFKYTVSRLPESSSYTSTNSSIEYDTTSLNALGSIFELNIANGGANYYSLPGISTISSASGSSAILEPNSRSIGVVQKTRKIDIGFDFPSDFSLRPSASLPQLAKMEPLSTIDYIGITSSGRGYSKAPKLVLLDGKTNQLIKDVDLKYTLGDSKVTILNNTFSLNNVKPTIIPTQNTNGIGIGSISYNSTNKKVTVVLSVGFSTENTFPFAINDKVLIENISVGVGSTGKGYNSEKYNYTLFTLTDVDQNLGGIGTVAYSLDGLLSSNEIPGIFDPFNSSGRIIPQKDFPLFNPVLKKGEFLKGETIVSDSAVGFVEKWDSKSSILSIGSKSDFVAGEVVKGTSSNASGLISNITIFDAFFKLNALSKVENGWNSNVGFLNDNLQRIQDSFYYQNFSYSLKSAVPYDDWEDVVGSLNHTAGFKKFSDLEMKSSLKYNSNREELNSLDDSLVVRSPIDSSFTVLVDFVSVVDLNCVKDFDLVRENALVSDRLFSDEITFSSRVLTDYFESVGNRVLLIDDVSYLFNSNPRDERYSNISRINSNNFKTKKCFIYTRDSRYYNERQITALSLAQNDGLGYLNQYARVETQYDMGSYDFAIEGSDAVLRFYPTKFERNNFNTTVLSYDVNDGISGIGSTNLNIVNIVTNNATVSSGTTTTIVSFDKASYRSSKLLIQFYNQTQTDYQFDEITLLHDDTDVSILEYGRLNTNLREESLSGFGTYNAYISGSNVILDFIPNAGIAGTVNLINTLITDSTGSTTNSEITLNHAVLEGNRVAISSTVSPISTVVVDYDDIYDTAYCIVQVTDTTNNRHQISEIVIIDDDSEVYFTEFGNIETSVGLGTFGATRSGGITQLTFTPLPNIAVDVRSFVNSISIASTTTDTLSLNNATIVSESGTYFGTGFDVKRSFPLQHNQRDIFSRYFDGSSSTVVDVTNNTVTVPGHFFVSGEEVEYSNGSSSSANSISIGSTFIVGIGTTDKLPSSVFIIKESDNKIKFAASAENALKVVPDYLNITSVGAGSSHTIVAKNKNSKVVVTIDNVIQSPVVSTAITSTLASKSLVIDDVLYFSGITSFFSGDLIKIEDEIMLVDSVGFGSTNAVKVTRPWMGTDIGPVVGYSTNTVVTKVTGSYNIVGNTINFASAPYGNVPKETTDPDERDWVGIKSSSSFHGRVFLKNGVELTTQETYYKNRVFFDVSSEFDGNTDQFILKYENQTNVTGVSTDNAIVLVNDIFQTPGLSNNYTLTESSGITTATFIGSGVSITSDPNTSTLPMGGVIVSVGSEEGFGYQPLVSAGGTAIVSGLGTISSVSIGNSGSGYRVGVQTVRVGVATSTTGTPDVVYVGVASVSNGNVVSIAITNPGVGYTNTNPPYVIIDSPLSYSNIPLVYSSPSSGIGTGAVVDIVVGQGSSVINFDLKNTGYGYGQGDVLTIPIGGSAGILTTSSPSFSEFKITVDRTFTDKFSGWYIGQLQTLDTIEDQFNGQKTSFQLKVGGVITSILSKRGTSIDVEQCLLVLLNDVLQVPGDSYIFAGGSTITFTEAPREGDSCTIVFYKGNGDTDVIFRNVIETVKEGDELTIDYDPSIGQSPTLQEEERTVTSVLATDVVETVPYFGPGNTADEELVRPVTWCRQTEDKIINGKEVGKSRELYEAVIYPSAYVIQTVSTGTTTIYVDNIRPFFNPSNENNISLTFQDRIIISSQDTKVSASATAIVSGLGTISSISLNSGGSGYLTTPSVSIQSPIGLGTTASATASATLTSDSVSTIAVTNPGTGYTGTNPPAVLIESPSLQRETNRVSSYSGDSGVIVGFGTTSVNPDIFQFVFDLYIPENSYLRQSSIAGSSTTISSLNVGDYFVVYGSNVGFSTQFLSPRSVRVDGSTIGLSTQFIDNVYQVESAENIQVNVTGIGTTYARRIFTRISGISTVDFSFSTITFDSTLYTFDSTGISTAGIATFSSGTIGTSFYFGQFSWGKIIIPQRSGISTYNFYGNNGVGGISTSAIVRRSENLRYENYIIT